MCCNVLSIDAGATQIQVFVKYTGSDINLIQVKDNGHGIQVRAT